jgi:FkbM family methyltransferase
MTLRTATDDRHLLLNIFGRDEYRLAEIEPRGADTVIDIGAHVGIFASRAAPFARRVLSYEPAPSTFRLLVDNVRRFANVTALPQAVTDRRGRAEIHVFREPSGNSLYPVEPAGALEKIAVDTVSLADVFTDHAVGRCSLLKLDCEGAEYPIIFGAPRDLWARIDRVAMEFHRASGADPSWSGPGLAEYLSGLGHEVDLHLRRNHPGKGLLFSARR